MAEHLALVAKQWYTERRGRINGNTKSWADLSEDERLNIMDSVSETLETMEAAWVWAN